MAKRFFDSSIWDSDDFISASPEMKLLFHFVIQKCDNIGIYKVSHKIASFLCGFSVDSAAILRIPCEIEELENGVFWVPKFIYHQYGELSETCKPHKRYMDDLKKMGLFDRVSIGYAKGIHTLEEKEKEKEKDKDKEIQAKIPTFDECRKEFLSRGQTEQEAERFFHFYESKGWLIGKVKMKQWKSAVAGWISRNETAQPKTAYVATSRPKKEY